MLFLEREMKKVLTIVGSVLLVVLLLWGYHSYQQSEQAKQERQKYENMGYYTGKWEIDSYEFLEDGRGVAVHWKSLTPEEDKLFQKYNPRFGDSFARTNGASNQRYITRLNIKTQSGSLARNRPQDESDGYFTLSIYRIRDKQLEESKVDLYQLVRDYNENYFPASTGAIVEINGKDYLPIAVYNPDWYVTKRKQLWLNLETKQIDWEDAKIQQYPESPSVDLGLLKDKMGKMTTDLRTSTADDLRNLNKLSFRQDVLKGSILETIAPKVYQVLSEKDSQFFLLIDSKYDYDKVYGDVPQFLDLFQLFVPANTNLYEGLTIPAELSKDGQEHFVNTKEEFDLYYDVAKDRELNKQRRILVEKGE